MVNTSNSHQLYYDIVPDNIEASSSGVLHRDTRFIPKKAVGGKGCYLFLEDGQKVLDSTGGAAVSCLGHGNDKINQAVIDQINQISYCHTAFFGAQASEDLARFLVDSTGGKLSKLYVVSSGSYPCLQLYTNAN